MLELTEAHLIATTSIHGGVVGSGNGVWGTESAFRNRETDLTDSQPTPGASSTTVTQLRGRCLSAKCSHDILEKGMPASYRSQHAQLSPGAQEQGQANEATDDP